MAGKLDWFKLLLARSPQSVSYQGTGIYNPDQGSAGLGVPDFPASNGDREAGKFRPSQYPRFDSVAVSDDDGNPIGTNLLDSLQRLVQLIQAQQQAQFIAALTNKPVNIAGVARTVGATFTVGPVEIPGTTASAYGAGNALGSMIEFTVPRRGVIYYATMLDPSNQGLEVDLPLFASPFTQTADHSAFAMTAGNARAGRMIGQLKFSTFTAYGSVKWAELNPYLEYYAPSGIIYSQALSVGTPTYAAGTGPPVITLNILPAIGDAFSAVD